MQKFFRRSRTGKSKTNTEKRGRRGWCVEEWERGEGIQETTGMCVVVGGWVAWREDSEKMKLWAQLLVGVVKLITFSKSEHSCRWREWEVKHTANVNINIPPLHQLILVFSNYAHVSTPPIRGIMKTCFLSCTYIKQDFTKAEKRKLKWA